jgi:hypothetical protein
VPLAHHRRAVARLSQGLGQGALVGGQAVGVAGEDRQGLEAVANRIERAPYISEGLPP